MVGFTASTNVSTGMKAMSPLEANLTLRHKEYMALESTVESVVSEHLKAREENSHRSKKKVLKWLGQHPPTTLDLVGQKST